MGRVFWMTSVAAAAAVIYGLNETAGQAKRANAAKLASAQSNVNLAANDAGQTAPYPVLGQSGSALATAAFGMSALQPETYDGDMVASIIAASPLEEVEKVQLTSNLQLAEDGNADLHLVLSDVRSALAVE